MKEYLKPEELLIWKGAGLSDDEILEKLINMYNTSMSCLYEVLAREMGTVFIRDLNNVSEEMLNMLDGKVKLSFKDRLELMAKERGIKL